MHSPLDVWKQGDPLTAAHLNQVVEAMNRYVSLAMSEGQDFIQTPGGTAISPSPQTVKGGLFPVNLVVTDGQDAATNGGNKTTAASWTYTVNDLYGEELGAELSPSWGRPSGKLNSASKGIAYYDTQGDLVLLQANELPGTGSCA